jgi:hypothetical protein
VWVVRGWWLIWFILLGRKGNMRKEFIIFGMAFAFGLIFAVLVNI